MGDPNSEIEQSMRRNDAWARRYELREYADERSRAWAIVVGAIGFIIFIAQYLR